MKKKVFSITFGILFLIFAGISLTPEKALASIPQELSDDPGDSGGAIFRIIGTRCVCVATGETIAYSNNCGTGTAWCTDRECPTSCPD